MPFLDIYLGTPLGLFGIWLATQRWQKVTRLLQNPNPNFGFGKSVPKPYPPKGL